MCLTVALAVGAACRATPALRRARTPAIGPLVGPAITLTPRATRPALGTLPSPLRRTSPLTGRPISARVLSSRPIAVALASEQVPASHDGIMAADVVFEPTDRPLLAVFHSNAPHRVGPVGVAGQTAAELALHFDAAVSHAGTRLVTPGSVDAGTATLPAAYRLRGSQVVVDVADVRVSLSASGLDRAPAGGWQFSMSPPSEPELSQVAVLYPGGRPVVQWTWDGELGRWRRWVGRQPHVDPSAGLPQVLADNVVILTTSYTGSDGGPDLSPGKGGDASVYRDARVVQATWWRHSAGRPVAVWRGLGQQPASLKPGSTWIMLLDASVEVRTAPRS